MKYLNALITEKGKRQISHEYYKFVKSLLSLGYSESRAKFAALPPIVIYLKFN